MRSLSRSKYRKAQFFIISAFTIVTILYFISRWMEPYTIPDTSVVVWNDEPFVLNNVIEKTKETIKNSKDIDELKYNLQEFEDFVREYGIIKNLDINFNVVNITELVQVEQEATPVDVMLVTDISGSMMGHYSTWNTNCRLTCTAVCNPAGCKAGDPGDCVGNWSCSDCDADGNWADTGESPCSINDARNASKTFVDQLNSTRDRSGVVAFNQTAYRFQNLSFNKDTVKTSINTYVHSDYDASTGIGEGTIKATEHLNTSGRVTADWIQILLTDGMNNAGRNPMVAARGAATNNTKIYTIGLGDPAYFDEQLLVNISIETGGKYYWAPSSTDLEDIYKEIAKEVLGAKGIVFYCVNITSTQFKLGTCRNETFA